MKITKTVVRKLLKIVDCGLIQGAGTSATPGQVCVEQAVTMALGEPLSDQPKCVSDTLRRFKIKLNDSNWSSNEARAKGMRRLAIAQLGTEGTLDEKEFVKRLAKMTIKHSIPEAFNLVAKTAPAEWKARIIKVSKNCKKLGTRQSAIEARDEMREYRRFAYAAYADAAYAAAAYAYAAADAVYAAADVYAAYAANAAAYAADAADAYAAYAANAAAYAADAAAYAAVKRDQSLSRYAEKVVQILVDMDTPGSKFLDLTEE